MTLKKRNHLGQMQCWIRDQPLNFLKLDLAKIDHLDHKIWGMIQ